MQRFPKFSHIGDLHTSEYERVASTYSLMIGLFADSAATPEDFVSSAQNILFTSRNEETARLLAKLIYENRDEISINMARAQLAGAILPSLTRLDTAVDIRVRVVNGEIKMGVPIAVLHIDTDVNNRELWLQLSIGDVEESIRKLSETLESMKVAETLTFNNN